ncbi:MAG: hypothetical protein IPP34_18625 [Bacteroidetes bacterium]|nr:hypothetical protein [Bacteroidota bacterium]
MSVSNCKIGYNITGATTSFTDNNNEINSEVGGSSGIYDIGDGVATGSTYGVFASYQSNLTIKNTGIANITGKGTTLVYGITLQSSASNSCDISDNTIGGINGGGTVYGIYITSAATANIYNNRVSSLATTGSSSSVRGIYLTATGLMQMCIIIGCISYLQAVLPPQLLQELMWVQVLFTISITTWCPILKHHLQPPQQEEHVVFL